VFCEYKKKNLSKRSQDYIKQYQLIYKRKPKIRGGDDRHVKTAQNKTKALWQLINEETGKFPSYDQKTELKTEIGIITHLQMVTKMLDSHFVEIVARLI